MGEFTGINNVVERLLILDEYCKESGIKGELVLLGASGVMAYMELVVKETFRSTMDIDVDILESNKTYKEFQDVLQAVNIDVVGGVMHLPPIEDFNDKNEMYKMDIDFTSIKVYIPSIELLACSKLFTNRQKDLDDLENTKILDECDLDKLEEMTSEYIENLINPSDTTVNIFELDRLLKEKGLK